MNGFRGSSIPCIYQDENLLIINKPPGLLSIPDGYQPDLPHIRTVMEPIYGKLWLIHRLDKETSGVLVLARNPETHRIMNQLFRDRQIEKIYHCLVYPRPNWHELDIQLPLLVNADREHRTRVNLKEGKPARSICCVKKFFQFGALIEINILTGITHQIRVHLREKELVIIGDKLYNTGMPPQPIDVPRMMLHARRVAFQHPKSAQSMEITANYLDDFRQAYTNLKMTTMLDEAF